MTDHPMLFSGPMIRALLAGNKSQTRRVMTPQPELLETGRWHVFNSGGGLVGVEQQDVPNEALDFIRWQLGDRLWVKETWQLHSRATDLCTVVYAASVNCAWTEANQQLPDNLAGKLIPKPFQAGWRPSIFMPRWASRLSLIITDVCVKRLQSITGEDAIAEGIVRSPHGNQNQWCNYPLGSSAAGWIDPSTR